MAYYPAVMTFTTAREIPTANANSCARSSTQLHSPSSSTLCRTLQMTHELVEHPQSFPAFALASCAVSRKSHRRIHAQNRPNKIDSRSEKTPHFSRMVRRFSERTTRPIMALERIKTTLLTKPSCFILISCHLMNREPGFRPFTWFLISSNSRCSSLAIVRLSRSRASRFTLLPRAMAMSRPAYTRRASGRVAPDGEGLSGILRSGSDGHYGRLGRKAENGAPAWVGGRPVSSSRVAAHRHHPCGLPRYAMICGIGTPWTSVSRMSRPL